MDDIRAALRAVAGHFHGRRGTWALEAFDWINAHLFDGQLPPTLIHWGITAHGMALGLAHAGPAPTITLHPSLLGGTERANPWGLAPELLGPALAFDVLTHECIHVRIGGRTDGPTSHNCDAWIAEVNRLAPLLGIAGTAARSKTRREGTRVVRATDGTLPFRAVATFPNGARDPSHFRTPPPVAL